MCKLLTVLLAVLCLLTGCGNQGNGDPPSAQSEDLDALFESQSTGNDVGGVDFSLDDPMETVYTYTGQPLKIPFTITGAYAGMTEVGVLLFVDGIAQPYAAVYEDGSELTADYMQVFRLENGQKDTFDMAFQPVTGRAGETVSIMAVTILKPGFIAESESNPRYGFYHADSATVARHISFESDAPAQALAVAATDYVVSDLSNEVLDRLKAWGALGALDTTAELSLGVDEGNVIRTDGKAATITVRLYGGPEANFNITLFVNHQPVQINDTDYLSVRTEKNKMVEATFQFDTADLGELNTIYAIAVTAGADDALQINNPIKSSSILMVNKEDL